MKSVNIYIKCYKKTNVETEGNSSCRYFEIFHFWSYIPWVDVGGCRVGIYSEDLWHIMANVNLRLIELSVGKVTFLFVSWDSVKNEKYSSKSNCIANIDLKKKIKRSVMHSCFSFIVNSFICKLNPWAVFSFQFSHFLPLTMISLSLIFFISSFFSFFFSPYSFSLFFFS